METNDIFADVLRDIRQAVNKSNQDPRPYNRQQAPEKFYTPQYARFKLVIYFKDGRARWFYSYDLQKFQNSAHLDEYNSMVKLLRIVKNNAGNYKTAVLYATTAPKPETASADYSYMIAKYDYYQNMLTNQNVNFALHGQDMKLDLFRLSQGQKVLIKN